MSRYPRWVSQLALSVIASTILSAIIGWVWPGPIAGLGLPLSLTAWWALYRYILWREARNAEG